MSLSKIKEESLISFIYKSYNKIFHKEIPFKIAKFLVDKTSNKNKIQITTYDGSEQCVHPDVIEYKDRLYMCFTPYPFGIDTYENPSIVYLNNKRWEYWSGVSPLVKETDFHYHLSDPCLTTDDQTLYLFYRRTEKSKCKASQLFFIMSKNGENWSAPTSVELEIEHDFISPAVILTNRWHLIYVNVENENNALYILSGDMPYNYDKREKVKLEGFKNERLWHIGIVAKNNYNSKYSADKSFACILTNINEKGKYSIHFGTLTYCEEKWVLNCKKEIVNQDILNCKIVYKSTLCKIGSKAQIFISMSNNNNCWKIFQYNISTLFE